jgi:F0F1-type ATP synthase assembly protein I
MTIKPPQQQTKYLAFLGLGSELLILMFGGAYLGQILDQKYALKGFGVIGMLLIGFITWVIHLIFLIRRLENAQKDSK